VAPSISPSVATPPTRSSSSGARPTSVTPSAAAPSATVSGARLAGPSSASQASPAVSQRPSVASDTAEVPRKNGLGVPITRGAGKTDPVPAVLPLLLRQERVEVRPDLVPEQCR
jgi:hypothetical protein